MKEKIKRWIGDNYPTKESCQEMCGVACDRLMAEFKGSGLQITFGYVVLENEKEIDHWYCKLDGEIVDPTAAQFDYPIIRYVEAGTEEFEKRKEKYRNVRLMTQKELKEIAKRNPIIDSILKSRNKKEGV